MNPTLYSLFYSYGQLLHYTGSLGLLSRHPQDALRHEAPSSFSHPNRPEHWILVQCNQPATHQRSASGTGGPPVPQPLLKVFYCKLQLPTPLYETQ